MIGKIDKTPDFVTNSGMSKWISMNNYDGINERVDDCAFSSAVPSKSSGHFNLISDAPPPYVPNVWYNWHGNTQID